MTTGQDGPSLTIEGRPDATVDIIDGEAWISRFCTCGEWCACTTVQLRPDELRAILALFDRGK